MHPFEKASERIADLIQDPAVLFDESEWPRLSEEICRILLPFLPKEPPPDWVSHPLFVYRNPESASREGNLARRLSKRSEDSSSQGSGPDRGSSEREDSSGAPADDSDQGGSRPEASAETPGLGNDEESGSAVGKGDDADAGRNGRDSSTAGNTVLTETPWVNREGEEVCTNSCRWVSWDVAGWQFVAPSGS